jgi:hypothetical protein
MGSRSDRFPYGNFARSQRQTDDTGRIAGATRASIARAHRRRIISAKPLAR